MIKIENTEIKTWDKHVETIIECTIKGSVFSSLRNESSTFHSDIFKYDDVNVVVNRESRFGEFYYNFAVYNDAEEKAWPLLTLPAKLDISIRRFDKELFLIWTDSQDPAVTDIKQCSFCQIQDTEKINNITVDFNKLNGIHILPGNFVLIAYMQKIGGTAGVPLREISTLALYESSGKLVKTIYEFYNDDKDTFSYTFNEEKLELVLIQKPKGEKKIETPLDLESLCKKS